MSDLCIAKYTIPHRVWVKPLVFGLLRLDPESGSSFANEAIFRGMQCTTLGRVRRWLRRSAPFQLGDASSVPGPLP